MGTRPGQHRGAYLPKAEPPKKLTETEIEAQAKRMEKACAGCVYQSETVFYKGRKICDYLEIVGHCRPCPPAEQCTVKLTEKRKPRRSGWREEV